MSGGAAAAAAAAAAAVARRRMEMEEEFMTQYSSDELAQNWEFKIVRANTAVFKNAATFKRLIEEEARAGWTLVEKFDNTRVRFKRPQQARLNDATLQRGVDPYRVQYGMSPGTYSALLTLTLLGVVFGFMAWLAHALK